jgi:hypothetical protein
MSTQQVRSVSPWLSNSDGFGNPYDEAGESAVNQPIHCGFWMVPSNCVLILNRSYVPFIAA